MGNGILMNSENVSGTGAEAIKKSESFNTLKDSFYTGVSKITDANVWTGEDADEFKRIADEMKSDLEQAGLIIEEVGTDLKKTAADFDQTVADNKARLSGV